VGLLLVTLATLLLGIAPASANATPAVGISVGRDFACAVLQGGSVECWGYGGLGELGNGTNTGSSKPVLVSGIGSAISVSAGYAHACAVLQDGSVECWGWNSWGQLGDGTTKDSSTPVRVGGVSGAVAVAAGEYHTCALISGGSVECWGSNYQGELGNATNAFSSTMRVPTPVPVTGLTDALALSAGGEFTCALVSGGEARCWGRGADGQLGNDENASSVTPVSVVGVKGAVALSAGLDFACAILSGGGGECWGFDSFGELGDTGSPTVISATPRLVSGLTGASSVGAGDFVSCAVSSGLVECWGDGPLGNGKSEASYAVTVSGLSNAIAVDSGGAASCALLADGSIWCWGSNSSGQLGVGSGGQSLTPVRVSDPVSNAPGAPAQGETPTTGATNGSLIGSTSNGASSSGAGLGGVGAAHSSKPLSPHGSATISPAAVFSLPSVRQCVSRRHFVVHVRSYPHVNWIGAVIAINGRRTQTIGRSHIRSYVSLVGLPKGRFVLTITATASTGRKVTGTRVYHTCVPKRKAHYSAPKL